MQTRASLVFASFLGLILPGPLACSNELPEPAPSAAKAAAVDSETEAVAKQGSPKIVASEAVFDFGTIKPKETIEHVFTIKNEGDGDLHIDHVQKT